MLYTLCPCPPSSYHLMACTERANEINWAEMNWTEMRVQFSSVRFVSATFYTPLRYDHVALAKFITSWPGIISQPAPLVEIISRDLWSSLDRPRPLGQHCSHFGWFLEQSWNCSIQQLCRKIVFAESIDAMRVEMTYITWSPDRDDVIEVVTWLRLRWRHRSRCHVKTGLSLKYSGLATAASVLVSAAGVWSAPRVTHNHSLHTSTVPVRHSQRSTTQFIPIPNSITNPILISSNLTRGYGGPTH